MAQLLADDRVPPPSPWEQELVSSRLLQYESWVVLHARKLATTRGEELQELHLQRASAVLHHQLYHAVREGGPPTLVPGLDCL